MFELITAALIAACTVGGSECPKGSFCTAEWNDKAQTCPGVGQCEPLPAIPSATFSLPVPKGEAVYCGKKGPAKPGDSHNGCNPSNRFAVDLVSSAFTPPHLVVSSADGVAWPVGGCFTKDLTHQDGEDFCNQGWGNYVRVQHEGGLYSQYAHLAAILVDAGKAVKRGDPIGIEGNTGIAGAKHIHWSVHRGTAKDGGPSIPFKVATSSGPVPLSDLACGDWTKDAKPDFKTRYVSENLSAAPPETFEFRAQLMGEAERSPRCPPSYTAIGSDACLARPAEFKDPRRIIVFFHGMMRPEAISSAAELIELASMATGRGYAVLAMLGEPGLCDWSPEFKSHLCFPSAKSQLPQFGQFLKVKLAVALRGARRSLSADLTAPFLLGFSNGGFFVSMLAAESQWKVAGYAVLHGGLPQGLTQFDKTRARPTLLIAASEDPWQLPKMQALSKAMSQSDWPNELRVRAGGHGLQHEDAKAALDFFDATLAAGPKK